MDPSTWPTWLKILGGFGPLGIWSAVVSWAYWKKDREHSAVRDAHTAAATEQSKAFADMLKAQADDFASKLAAAEARHFEQLKEQNARLNAVTDAYAERNQRLTEKVAVLVDALGRRGGG